MSLNNPDTHASVRVHKAILASGSQWFLRVFCTEAAKKEEGKEVKDDFFTAVEVPRPIGTAVDQPRGQVSDEIVMRILKYLYHN